MNVQNLAEAQRQADFARLPLFYGNDKDTFTAEQWIARIDAIRTAAAWNEQLTQTTVYNALRGDALVWYDAVKLDIDCNTYVTFKNAFLQAWSKTRTARTTTAVLAGLQQMQNETVTNFYARVRKAMDDIISLEGVFALPADPLPADLMTIHQVVAWLGANPANDVRQQFGLAAAATNQAVLQRYLENLMSQGASYRQDRLGKHIFIAGLKPYIRDELMKNPPVGGLYVANQTAHNIEKCMTDPRVNRHSTAAIEPVERNDVAALQNRGSFRGRTRGRGFSRGRFRGRGGQSFNKANMSCYHCGKKGHFEAECHAKARGEPRTSTVAPVETEEQEQGEVEEEYFYDYLENSVINLN